jgi:hypothetical protein
LGAVGGGGRGGGREEDVKVEGGLRRRGEGSLDERLGLGRGRAGGERVRGLRFIEVVGVDVEVEGFRWRGDKVLFL